MKRLIPISLLLISTSSLSQNNFAEFGIRLDLGISSISPLDPNSNSVSIHPMPSGSFGFTFKYKTSKILAFEIDLLFSQINARQKSFQVAPYQGCIYCTGTTHTTLDFYLSYVTVPIYLTVELKNISVGAGVRPGLNIIDQAVLNETGEILGSPYEIKNARYEYNLKFFDFGPSFFLDYQFSERWGAGISAYTSALKVKHKTYGALWYNYQFGIGLNYTFSSRVSKAVD